MITTSWQEPVLDTLALVRAAITYDHEAQQILLAYGEPDQDQLTASYRDTAA